MKPFVRVKLLLAFLLLTALPALASAQEGSPGGHAPARVIVELEEGAAASALAGANYEHLFGNWYRVSLGAQSLQSGMSALAERPGVRRAEPDSGVSMAPSGAPLAIGAGTQAVASVPNDPIYFLQWHLPQVQAQEAWDVTTGDGVVVAVIDSGVSTAGSDGFCHPLAGEYNAFTNSSAAGAANDDQGWGTHIAGTIAQCTDNGDGTAGLAYDAGVMAVKVCDSGGFCLFSDMAEGIDWAATHGADVIYIGVMSDCGSQLWPSCNYSAALSTAISNAAAADVVLIAPAGNANQTVVAYPANHPDVMAVVSTGYNKVKAPYSSRGAAASLSAPGGNNAADLNNDTWPDGVLQETFAPSWGYWFFQGTPMASAHVAGAAALLRSCVPDADRADVQAALEESALDLGTAGFDNTYGHGFLQIYSALLALAADFTNHCDLPTSPSLYVSALTAGNVGGVAATPQDILFRDGTANTWAMHFDGSDVGVTKAISSFARMANGDLLLALKANQSLPGVGAVTPWDVVRFSGSYGNTTSGTFSWYIDGSDVGLTTTAEKIDALDVLSDGKVVVSTAGTLSAAKTGGGTLKSQDEDLSVLNHTALGATTAGTWALYFNGTAVSGMGVEDVSGAHVDTTTGDIYVSITGAFNIGGKSGNGKDILVLSPSGGGYSVDYFWRGGDNGFNLNLGGIEIPN